MARLTDLGSGWSWIKVTGIFERGRRPLASPTGFGRHAMRSGRHCIPAPVGPRAAAGHEQAVLQPDAGGGHGFTSHLGEGGREMAAEFF